ncbi:intersectin-EH binding protein Ibp1 [Mycolicibacterium moriokaense]|nr:intersectin-EH binding protein Ibp1 [Mycolicibacterium moriokaense]
MATFHLPTRRLILAGGFAVAIAAAPAVAMLTVATSGTAAPSISACAGGETEDMFTNNCVPDIVPNSPDFSSTAPVGGLPEVNGIPCTGANSGQCIGLSEEQQPPIVQPHSEVSSSP